MLIFGWRNRTKHLGGGTFHCPVCNAARQYEHVEARRWFTLFFVPIIPAKRLGEFVRCLTCKVTLDPVVLHDRAIEQANYGSPSAAGPRIAPGSELPPPTV